MIKLHKLIKEGGEIPTEDTRLDKVDKQAFLAACKNFSQFQSAVYRPNKLSRAVEEIGRIIDVAEQMTLQETENWFDGVTVKRHIKQMNEAYKTFQKTAGEALIIQQRMESAYEDIGEVLRKYYDV